MKISKSTISLFISAWAMATNWNSDAQTQYRFQHLNTKHGLANEFAWDMVQDSLGYIWIGYYGGLSRFDGYNFKLYKYNPSDSTPATPDFILMRLDVDQSNTLWLQGHPLLNGVMIMAKHDVRTDGFIRFEFPPIRTNIISRFFEKDEKTLWLGTMSEGLYHFDIKSRSLQNYFNTKTNPHNQQGQNSIYGIKDLDKAFLLATSAGLWLFDKDSKSFIRPPCKPSDSTLLYSTPFDNILESPNYKEPGTWLSSGNWLIKIDSNFLVAHHHRLPEGVRVGPWARDRNGVYWFGTNQGGGGLNIYDPSTNKYQVLFHNPSEPWSLPSNDVIDVLIDRDDNVWIGTVRGISILKKRDLNFYNTKIGQGIGASLFLSTKDGDHLLVAVRQGEQFDIPRRIYSARLNSKHIDSLIFTPTQLISANGTLSFLHRGMNHLWTLLGWGTPRRQVIGYPIDKESGLASNDLPIILEHAPGNANTLSAGSYDMWESPNANLFVSHHDGVDVVRSDLMYGTEGSVIRLNIPGANFFYPEDDESFWVVRTKNLQLYRFSKTNAANGRLETVLELEETPRLMHKTKDGTLFLGTFNGLYEGIKSGDRYTFSKVPRLNTAIIQIQEDNEGRLWIYADNKLTCYDRKNDFITTFGEKDGLDHFQEHRNIAVQCLNRTSDGIMALASTDGIALFDPSTFKISQKKTNPVLTALSVNNLPVDGGQLTSDIAFKTNADISVLTELKLDYQHNNFSIEFSAMEMTAPEKNLYKHMLEGYDKDWIETDAKNRTATYTNLPSGSYTFRVKASNHHGVWSDNERTLEVIILPPPWRTWWAYTGYGFIVFGLLFGARRLIVQRERYKASMQLEHLELEKAKEVDRVKTSFFTNISHEFRTPLTLIKGPVQNMIEQFVNGQTDIDRKKIVDQLKLIQRNSDLLLKLINQLLDLAKLESGSLKVEKSEGEVFSFVRAIVSSFESFARHKNVSLQINVPEESCPALFDKDKVETILINLINNAIKFTPTGGIVTVSTVLRFDTSVLVLIIKDTGIGIPSEHQSKIFERFHQVSEAHKEVGTGIGLALVKELVALMGGEISVQSEVGVGSEFTVHIPIEKVTNQQLPLAGEPLPMVEHTQPATGDQQRVTKPHPSDDGGSTKPHVLIVEDNTDLRHFIIDSMGEEFNFLEAENGKQGLEKAIEQIPDMIISDVMMPEMDGIIMTEKIKKDLRTSHIPLILLTAKSSEDSKLHGLESGADDYLTKPFNKQELLLKVRNGVSRQVKLRERLRAELMSTAPKVEVLSEDEKFLHAVKDKILERLSDEQLSVESLADDLGMSRVQLYRKVSGLTDISVNELIRKLRLQRAAQLLQQNWGPVSQVAYEVGFSNLSYFSKVFREEFGVLPSDYEKSIEE